MTKNVSISRANKKMSSIPSISFPPVVTCANCSECAKKCYALRMANFRPSIKNAWQNNLDIYKSNPDAVKYAIITNSITSSYFRYFVGGDIVDYNFFAMMVDIAKTVKTCQYLAFTKKYDIVNQYISNNGDLPSNLHIIMSKWDRDIPNPHNLPTSQVIFKGEQIPPNSLVCGGNCADCICQGIGCWQLAKGEQIHFIEH